MQAPERLLRSDNSSFAQQGLEIRLRDGIQEGIPICFLQRALRDASEDGVVEGPHGPPVLLEVSGESHGFRRRLQVSHPPG